MGAREWGRGFNVGRAARAEPDDMRAEREQELAKMRRLPLIARGAERVAEERAEARQADDDAAEVSL